MTSEIRVNKLTNRIGLSTVTFADSGIGVTVTGRIDPDTDSARDLGTSSVRWRNAYVDTYYGDGSNLTGVTGTTINNNANNRIITGSGTANTLEAETSLEWNGTNTLTVVHPSSYQDFIVTTSAGGSGFELFRAGNGPFRIRSASTSPSSEADELVIGATNSTRGLTIFGDTNNIYFGDAGDNDIGKIQYVHSDNSMRFTTNTTEKLRITSAGHIQLQGGTIYGDDSAAPTFKLQSTSGNSNHSRIEIGAIQNSDNGGIHFYTAGSSAATRHMTLKGTSGYLGVGVDDPISILHLHEAGSNGAPIIQFSNGDTGTTTGDGFAIGLADNESPFIFNRENTHLRIATNNTERFRITAGGQVNIGNALSNTSRMLAVETTHASGGEIAYFGNNDGSNNYGGLLISGGETDRECRLESAFGNSFMTFHTNSGEKLVINADGMAQFKGKAGSYYGVPTTNNHHQFNNTGSGHWICQMRQEHHNGLGLNIRMGSTGNQEALQVYYYGSGASTRFRVLNNGNVGSASNSYGGISDIKLKENIVDAKSQWDDIKALKVRNFNFKNTPDTKMLGVVAQEIETVSPGLVSDMEDKDPDTNESLGTTTKEVKYSILYMKAIKCLQEAQARIEKIEEDNIALRARVTNLEGN